jgi:hypothetical protein
LLRLAAALPVATEMVFRMFGDHLHAHDVEVTAFPTNRLAGRIPVDPLWQAPLVVEVDVTGEDGPTDLVVTPHFLEAHAKPTRSLPTFAGI